MLPGQRLVIEVVDGLWVISKLPAPPVAAVGAPPSRASRRKMPYRGSQCRC